jgi:hypothetical protein
MQSKKCMEITYTFCFLLILCRHSTISHRVSMHKILLFVLLMPLSWCSISQEENKWNITPIYSDINIQNILSYMEISKDENTREYRIMHALLTTVEAPCMGKWFLEYRECFTENLEKEEKNFEIDQILGDHLFLLKWSLSGEIAYFRYYQELDDAPMIAYSSNENVWCTIVGSIVLSENNHPFPVVLSYSDSLKEWNTLSLLWFSSQKSYTGSRDSFTHENPCEYHTFWPDIGNIFYAFQKENRTYLFIKSGDGGGSGEFVYTVFVNEWNNNIFQPIIISWWTNGVSPFHFISYSDNGQQTHIKRISILDRYKNQPFVYEVYFEDNRRWVVSAIGKLLESSLKY